MRVPIVAAVVAAMFLMAGIVTAQTGDPDVDTLTDICAILDGHERYDCTEVTTSLPPSTSAPTTTQPPATTTSVPSTTSSLPPATTTTLSQPTTTATTATSSTTTPSTVPATTSSLPPSTTVPPASSTTVPAGGAAFVEDFASAASVNRFVEHTGNYCSSGTSCRPENGHVGSFPGDHNEACGGPTTSRTVDVSDHDNLFWWCAPNGPDSGHVMIGNDISGYGIVSLSPDQTFTNLTKVCWDVNHTDLGGGKWFNVVIVPESLYLSNPNTNPRRVQDGEGAYRMDYTSPGFNDDNAPGDFNLQGGPTFGFKQFRTERSLWRNNGTDNFVWHEGGHHITTDKAARYTTCLEEVGSSVRITQTTPSGTTVDTVAGGGLPSGAVRVIFQDDTYDSIKHDGIPANKTWHLDNVRIEVAA